MIEVPTEARFAIQQFLDEQKAKEVRRLPENIDTKKQEAALAKLRNPCSGKEILKYAQICGCGVQHGGREGTYLVAPDNGVRLPVSVHGSKDSSPGQTNAAYKFVKAIVEQRIAAQTSASVN